MEGGDQKFLTKISEETDKYSTETTERGEKNQMKRSSINLAPITPINFVFEKDIAMEPLSYLDNLEFENKNISKKHSIYN